MTLHKKLALGCAFGAAVLMTGCERSVEEVTNQLEKRIASCPDQTADDRARLSGIVGDLVRKLDRDGDGAITVTPNWSERRSRQVLRAFDTQDLKICFGRGGVPIVENAITVSLRDESPVLFINRDLDSAAATDNLYKGLMRQFGVERVLR